MGWNQTVETIPELVQSSGVPKSIILWYPISMRCHDHSIVGFSTQIFRKCRDIVGTKCPDTDLENCSADWSSECIQMKFMIDKDYPGAERSGEHCLPKVPPHTASERLCVPVHNPEVFGVELAPHQQSNPRVCTVLL